MGQAKLRPDAARLGGKHPAGVLENPEPIAERFAYSRDMRQPLARPPGAPATRPARPAPARAKPAWLPARPRLPLLLAGLGLAALVPALIAGALWLGASGGPEPAMSDRAQGESPDPVAVLTAAERIDAVGGVAIRFPLALDGTDGVPPRSVIAIKGLPEGSNFSEGRPYGDREWSLRPDQIGDLSLVLPASANGAFELSIALIAPDDRVIAEARSVVVASSPPAPVATEEIAASSPAEGETAALAPDGVETAASDGVEIETAAPPGEADPAAPTGAEGAAAETGGAASETEPAPARRVETPPEDSATEDAPVEDAPQAGSVPADAAGSELGTVQPAMFVNLRAEPSSSAPVLGVIAKGADLPVLGRRRGWVKVAHPESGKQGWIYSGLLVGEAKPSQRVRRIAPAETEARSETFWGRIGRWLRPAPEQPNAD